MLIKTTQNKDYKVESKKFSKTHSKKTVTTNMEKTNTGFGKKFPKLREVPERRQNEGEIFSQE